MTIDERIEELQEEYQRTRTNALDMMSAMQELSAEVTSEDGIISIRVGAQGQVTDVTINNSRYRKLTQAELAESLYTVLQDAQTELRAKVLQMLPTTSPFGSVNTEELLDGSFDFASLLPEDLQLPELRFRTASADPADWAR